ncbi:MAG: hypothetical protein AB1374_12545 [Bacillota bacterium]
MDVFEAMTSDRPHRRAYPPHEAWEMLAASQGFDFEVRQAFLQSVAPYPAGSAVELSDGSKGIVLAVRKGLVLRPRVRLADGTEVDLAERTDLAVRGAA